MDPTLNLISIIPSRTKKASSVKIPKSYEAPNHGIPVLDIHNGSVNIPKSMPLNHPYEYRKVGKSIFFDQSAVQLANIDRILSVTPLIGGYFTKQSDKEFRYCIINPGSGGYDSYLQYRFPVCYGFGYTYGPNMKQFKENEKYIDTRSERYMNIEISRRNYITLDYKKISNKLSQNKSLDLVISSPLGEKVRKNEQIQRLAAQLYIAHNNLNSDGKWIVEIDNLDVADSINTNNRTLHIPTIQMIYIISLCFKKIILFKPLINPNNTYFLVAEVPIPITINPLLDEIIKFKSYPSTLIDNRTIDPNLIKYIQDIRMDIEQIIQVYNNIEFNYPDSLIYWDLPGNIDRESKISNITYVNRELIISETPITQPYDFTYFRYGKDREGASYPVSVDGVRSISSDTYEGIKMQTLESIK
uniref:FtsJ-like methyltransferase n=1 Tax=Pithovirus LCPAC101 TaxID=2506586 RepID=A0A481Z546_9VIRU|nr:MAG: FtsJ-like methyltransferase [Pithovirus LCPAC101]